MNKAYDEKIIVKNAWTEVLEDGTTVNHPTGYKTIHHNAEYKDVQHDAITKHHDEVGHWE